MAGLGASAAQPHHRNERVVARPRRPSPTRLMDPDGAFAGTQPEAKENCCRRDGPLPYEVPPHGCSPTSAGSERHSAGFSDLLRPSCDAS